MKQFILRVIKAWANRRSYKLAVAEAKRLRSVTFKKHFVIYAHGEFRAVSKQWIKELKRAGKLKNATVSDIEKGAVYTTK